MRETVAASVNRYAGSHPISSDPGEIEAARRAGEASLRDFPYYLERYGERARLFAVSDGAWLALLCDSEEERVHREAFWLSEVLSSRGMPSLLLGSHLRLLHGELVRTYPERLEHYRPLLSAAARLEERRRGRLSDTDARELDSAFHQRVGPPWSERLPGMGALLAAAVADEAEGIGRAVDSVESWATDPTRFPAEWIAAVQETIAAARRHLRPAADQT